MKRREETIHENLCNYIRMQYPDVIFFSDSSGLRLPMGLAVKAKKLRSSRGIPDLFICRARKNFGGNDYNGLFIEIKKEDAKVYLQNGRMSQDRHIREQDGILKLLGREGYFAEFGIGFDNCKEIIDAYLC